MRRKNSRSNRNHSEQSASHDRWLITYADLITLLMIFFVVMYAMSNVDAAKYQSLSSALNTTFSSGSGSGNLPANVGLLDGAYTRKPGETGALNTQQAGASNGDDAATSPDSSSANDSEEQSKPVMIGEITEKDLAFRKQEEQLQHVMSTIQQYIQDNQLETQITVTDTAKGVEIRLSDSLLFALGRADLTSAAYPTMDKLASLFSQLDTTISIEGHTDNLAIAPGGRYKDNWELSAERALSVLRYFVEQKNLNSETFQIAGYGDTRPVDSNETAEGRKNNRRVEIIILRSVMATE